MIELFGRHAREFGSALRDHQIERVDAGIYFPRQHALLHGHIKVETPYGVVRCPNLILGGSNVELLLANLLVSGGTPSALNNLYIAPWGNNVATNALWAAPHIATTGGTGVNEFALYYQLGELGGSPSGYSQSTRPAWTWVNIGGGLIDNSAAPAAFTMVTASTINVYGFALCQSNVKKRARPYRSGGDPGGGIANYSFVDVTNCHFAGIQTSSSGYVPTGAVATSSGATHEDSYTSGRAITVDGTHPGDPNEGPLDYLSTLNVTYWYDPSGDDYFDAGLGHWVDPSGDSMNQSDAASGSLVAIVRVPSAPLVFNNADPFNVTWGIQLS